MGVCVCDRMYEFRWARLRARVFGVGGGFGGGGSGDDDGDVYVITYIGGMYICVCVIVGVFQYIGISIRESLCVSVLRYTWEVQ